MQTENWSRSVDFIVFMNRGTRKMRKHVLAFVLSSPILLRADEQHQHFDANEMLGTVSFPISCAVGVQKPFERGVALLHSFGYDEAKKQFTQVAESDPKCAMAYWGQAMSLYHQLWRRPDAADLNSGWNLLQKAHALSAKTARECDYIEALSAFYRGSDKADHERRCGRLCAGDGEDFSKVS